MTRNSSSSSTFGQRIARFLGALLAIFMITAAVVVTQRLSSDALAMATGAILAAVLLLPIVGLCIFIMAKLWQRDRDRHYIPAQNQSQPIIVQVPMPMLPPQQPQQNILSDYQQWDQRTRSWVEIGGSQNS